MESKQGQNLVWAISYSDLFRFILEYLIGIDFKEIEQ